MLFITEKLVSLGYKIMDRKKNSQVKSGSDILQVSIIYIYKHTHTKASIFGLGE